MLDVFVRLYVYMWPKNRTGAQGASPRRFHIIYDRTALAAMLVPVIERSDPLGWGREEGERGRNRPEKDDMRGGLGKGGGRACEDVQAACSFVRVVNEAGGRMRASRRGPEGE